MAAPYHVLGGGQQIPSRYRPHWYVGNLVYQGGVPNLPRSSLVGGGNIPMRNPPAGREPLSLQPQASPVSSVAAGGFIASRPNFLTGLLKGGSSQGF